MSRRIAEIEAQHGKPFWEVLKDLRAEGLTRAAAARRLGYTERNPRNGERTFMNLLYRHPDKDPWGYAGNRAAEYMAETGESFTAAVRRLAKTHTVTAAARELGYSGPTALQYALRVRGIDVEFRPGRRRLPREAVERYACLRLDGVPSRRAAAEVGYCDRTLRNAVAREFPQLAGRLPNTRHTPKRKRNA